LVFSVFFKLRTEGLSSLKVNFSKIFIRIEFYFDKQNLWWVFFQFF
jgi:hypothetical protein